MKYIKKTIVFIILLPMMPLIIIGGIKRAFEVSFKIETTFEKLSYTNANGETITKPRESLLGKKAIAYPISLLAWAIIAYFIIY